MAHPGVVLMSAAVSLTVRFEVEKPRGFLRMRLVYNITVFGPVFRIR